MKARVSVTSQSIPHRKPQRRQSDITVTDLEWSLYFIIIDKLIFNEKIDVFRQQRHQKLIDIWAERSSAEKWNNILNI